jgi:hypothetical protein
MSIIIAILVVTVVAIAIIKFYPKVNQIKKEQVSEIVQPDDVKLESPVTEIELPDFVESIEVIKPQEFVNTNKPPKKRKYHKKKNVDNQQTKKMDANKTK